MKYTDDALGKLWASQTVDSDYCHRGISPAERAAGAIMGMLIGDALGQGCLWYYQFEQLWEDYGDWVDNYQNPKAIDSGCDFDAIANYRYRRGLRAGYNSQSGQLAQLLLETVAASKRDGASGFVPERYFQAVNKFFARELLPDLNMGLAERPKSDYMFKVYEQNNLGRKNGIHCFAGRYSDEVVRDAFDAWYDQGTMSGQWWKKGGSPTSTSDAAQWGVILSTLYDDPHQLFMVAYDFCHYWFSVEGFISTTIVYIMTVQAIINGIPIGDIGDYLLDTFNDLGVIDRKICSYDDAFGNAFVLYRTLSKPQFFQLQDDRFISQIYGMDCHVVNLMPAAYYLAYKYATDFEQGILFAVNSGGNNMARSALTGGLLGAMNGLSAIPPRFIHGLDNFPQQIPAPYKQQGKYLSDLAKYVTADVGYGKD
ncbi:MAG: ADP-ribosylglycohydrolase family protein [Clostridiales bacterium]